MTAAILGYWASLDSREKKAKPTIIEIGGEEVKFKSPSGESKTGFAPVKGDRPEWTVQKLTELGVDRIVPLRAARSVVRWDGERGAAAVERLRRVAREAAMQSRRCRLPEVTEMTSVPIERILKTLSF